MKLIICLDDKNGMMFHHRRQSQDRLLRQRILESISSPIWMSTYSAGQFENTPNAENHLRVADDFLFSAPDDAFCFVENQVLPPPESVDTLILYYWNRLYPSDCKFDWDLTTLGFSLQSSFEFPGSSHDKITEKVYSR